MRKTIKDLAIIKNVDLPNYRDEIFFPWFHKHQYDTNVVRALVKVVPQNCKNDLYAFMLLKNIEDFEHFFAKEPVEFQDAFIDTQKDAILYAYEDVLYESPDSMLLKKVQTSNTLTLHQPLPWQDRPLDSIICLKKNSEHDKYKHMELYTQHEAIDMLTSLAKHSSQAWYSDNAPYLLGKDLNPCIDAYRNRYNDPILLEMENITYVDPFDVYESCPLSMVDCIAETKRDGYLSSINFYDIIGLSKPEQKYGDPLLNFIAHFHTLIANPKVKAFFHNYLMEELCGYHHHHELPFFYLLAKMHFHELDDNDSEFLVRYGQKFCRSSLITFLSVLLQKSQSDIENEMVIHQLCDNIFDLEEHEERKLNLQEWKYINKLCLEQKHMMYNHHENEIELLVS